VRGVWCCSLSEWSLITNSCVAEGGGGGRRRSIIQQAYCPQGLVQQSARRWHNVLTRIMSTGLLPSRSALYRVVGCMVHRTALAIAHCAG
jgi:hypothetical protein